MSASLLQNSAALSLTPCKKTTKIKVIKSRKTEHLCHGTSARTLRKKKSKKSLAEHQACNHGESEETTRAQEGLTEPLFWFLEDVLDRVENKSNRGGSTDNV